MRIELLETGTVLVSLEDEELRSYQLDFKPQGSEPELKKGLLRVIRQVQSHCGMTGRGESYLVEALPGKKGCLLLITVYAVRHRRRMYRIKRSVCAALIFDSSDAMLDCMLAKNMPEKYELYLLRGSYVLLTEDTEGMDILSEYGTPVRMSGPTEARIREYGELVSQPR